MKTVTFKDWTTFPHTPEPIKWLIDNIGEPGYVGYRWNWEVYNTWYRITFNNLDDYTLFMLTHGGE